MNKFYIYEHIRLDTNTVFYVGKGKGDRSHSKSNRNQYWHNVVNKHGYSVNIIQEKLTEQEAFDLEIELIAHYGRLGINTGILINMTDGGEGISGMIHSSKTRNKMSKSQKGRGFSEESKKKMSESQKDKKRSIEHRKNISNSQTKRCNITAYKNGKIVGEYTSQRDCWKELNLDRGNLSATLRGRCKSCQGYTFTVSN